MENVDKLKVVYFTEGAHFATFDPPPACMLTMHVARLYCLSVCMLNVTIILIALVAYVIINNYLFPWLNHMYV